MKKDSPESSLSSFNLSSLISIQKKWPGRVDARLTVEHCQNFVFKKANQCPLSEILSALRPFIKYILVFDTVFLRAY